MACERSGRVRDAFRALGHDAMSADIEPTDVDGPHHQGDVRPLLTKRWDMVIAHPPCTDLSAAGAQYWGRKNQDAAALFFMLCYAANAPRVAVENPAGAMTRIFRRPDQYIQPWWFGDPYRKRTGLWLRGLPILLATDGEPEHVGDWHRQAQHLSKANRAAVSAQTFPGVANAMAHQWG